MSFTKTEFFDLQERYVSTMEKHYDRKLEMTYIVDGKMLTYEDALCTAHSRFLQDFAKIAVHFSLDNLMVSSSTQVFVVPVAKSLNEILAEMVAHDDVERLHTLCASYRKFYDEYRNQPGGQSPWTAWCSNAESDLQEFDDPEYTIVYTVRILGTTKTKRSILPESMQKSISVMCGCDDVIVQHGGLDSDEHPL